MTDFLHFQIKTFGVYDPIVPLLAEAIRATKSEEILDLCSGGSGPVKEVREQLEAQHGLSLRATLSDKYPNLTAFARVAKNTGGKIQFESKSLDATDVPPDYKGFRTLFSCFHHFPPGLGQKILQDAFEKRRGIAIFEVTQRKLSHAALMALSMPLTTLAVTPFLKPLSLSRFFLTYAVPVLPFAIAFDGTVSVLRSYDPEELLALTEPFQASDYRWQAGTVPHNKLPQKLTYLIGHPTQETKV